MALPSITVLIALLGVALVAACSLASAKSHVRGGAYIPGTLIPCYHKKSHRFTASAKPRDCVIAGYKGTGREFVAHPIRGMRWSEWGTFNTRGAEGTDLRTGDRVRVFAYRRVRCSDGRVFYSAALIDNLTTRNPYYFEVRMPTCRDQVPTAEPGRSADRPTSSAR